MKPQDEPAIKNAADAASNNSQYKFLALNKAQLALLGTSALISGWAPQEVECQRTIAIVTSLLMLAALSLGIALKIGRFDDRWFRCRAIAENVKCAMWQFVMSSEEDGKMISQLFRQQVAEIRERMSGLAALLELFRVHQDDITDWMKDTQKLSVDEKLSIFRKERVADQIEWYSAKAKFNALWEARWQWTVFVLEFLAVLLAVLHAWKLPPFNAVGGIAAVSAAIVAWTQTKRHSDLANSYAVAAEDLRRIGSRWAHATTQSEVKDFVGEVEIAVSREHSLWLSKRIV